MDVRKYFDKNKMIYGISEKFAYNQWIGYKVVFNDYDKALTWLQNEGHNFMNRQLCTKTQYNRCKYRNFNPAQYL